MATSNVLTLRNRGRVYRFDSENKLGSGKKGKVLISPDQNFVARVLECKDFKKDELANAVQQLTRLTTHRSLLATVDIILQDDQCYVISEKASGRDLFSSTENPAFADNALEIMHQLVAAIKHLHDNGQTHGNLTPADVFVDFLPTTHADSPGGSTQSTTDQVPDVVPRGNVTVQVADAGIVGALTMSSFRANKLTEFLDMNAMKYIPPEFFNSSESPSTRGKRWCHRHSDVFSLGKMMAEIMKGSQLGDSGAFGSHHSTFSSMTSSMYSMSMSSLVLPTSCDDLAKLVKKMTSQAAERRPNIGEVHDTLLQLVEKKALLQQELDKCTIEEDIQDTLQKQDKPAQKTQPTKTKVDEKAEEKAEKPIVTAASNTTTTAQGKEDKNVPKSEDNTGKTPTKAVTSAIKPPSDPVTKNDEVKSTHDKDTRTEKSIKKAPQKLPTGNTDKSQGPVEKKPLTKQEIPTGKALGDPQNKKQLPKKPDKEPEREPKKTKSSPVEPPKVPSTKTDQVQVHSNQAVGSSVWEHWYLHVALWCIIFLAGICVTFSTTHSCTVEVCLGGSHCEAKFLHVDCPPRDEGSVTMLYEGGINAVRYVMKSLQAGGHSTQELNQIPSDPKPQDIPVLKQDEVKSEAVDTKNEGQSLDNSPETSQDQKQSQGQGQGQENGGSLFLPVAVSCLLILAAAAFAWYFSPQQQQQQQQRQQHRQVPGRRR